MPQILKPPIFKICAEIEFWNPADPTPRPALLIVEECIATSTPNYRDLKALAKSSVMGKLAKFGVDTTKVDYQFTNTEFFAARTRDYTGSFLEANPEWVPAYNPWSEPINDVAKAEAIRNLTYLPLDIEDQRDVYGALESDMPVQSS